MTRDVVKEQTTRRPELTGHAATDFRAILMWLTINQLIPMRQHQAIRMRSRTPPVPWDEIARIQQCSIRTSRTHYERAIKTILRHMEDI